MDSATTPRVVGRYVLYGELAAGGMATVHYGRLSGPVGFSRTVAIKRLHPQFAKDPEFVTMFLDEARLCGRIRHPNVVPTLDVVTNDGEIFLVMEYVAGESFARLLKAAAARGMRVPTRVAASILSSVLHGLNEAHQTKDEHGRELGIVHRDVSPQNILVGGDGIARVLDFGVAKAAGRLQTTREGQVKGKIAYMPPEQISGGSVTRQIDIYAAAVVLWEALAGRRLFDGETEAMVLVRALEGKIEPVSQYNPEVAPAIDALLARGLARDPAARFATAREMALALEQTIGLASPSEVGAWVESVAGDELGLRARNVAEIEVASVTGTIPRIPTRTDAADVHSQVSSISVSRPLSTRSGPGSRLVPVALATTGAAALAAAALVLVVARGGLERAATAGTAPPNTWVHERRPLTVTGPAMAPGKFVGEPTPTTAAPTPGPTVLAKKPPACDPPFTMDPVTGRKKYKVECFK